MEPVASKTIATANYNVHIGHGVLGLLPGWVGEASSRILLVVVDSHTGIHCLPKLEAVLGAVECVAIPAGESQKNLGSCQAIWARLTELQAGRDALVLNLGGGMVGDLGGFAAACYKRGVAFIQIPTSLLAMVDASVGGKTGLNFMGFKNQIGAFQDPMAVLVDPSFLTTLPERELRSGYAEVLKHALIADAARWHALSALPSLPENWEAVIAESIGIKARIVHSDPLEKGPRAALNFGHTVGHALESHSLAHSTQPLLHGEAVAYGMVCEAWLSTESGLLSSADRDQIAATLLRIFGKPDLAPELDGDILHYCLQDKKNHHGQIRCTLLEGIGGFRISQEVHGPQILQSLQFLREFQ